MRRTDDVVLFVCGIPAIGKSSFCCYLAREHAFEHYDLERYPDGWPRPSLHGLWEQSRQAFLDELRREHAWVVLDWGFPLSHLAWAVELRNAGARTIWFAGDLHYARRIFVNRGKGDVGFFDRHVGDLATENVPEILAADVISVLDAQGSLRKPSELYEELFREVA